MKNPLVRCSSCKRHYYTTESSCPFCTRQASASPGVLAAAFTAGLAVAGCGGENAQSRPPIEIAAPPDAPPDTPSDQPKEIATNPTPDPPPPPPNYNVAPAYGAPPVPVETPIGPPAAAYGAPPPPPKPR